jgi:hypothetical protein
MIDCLIDQLSQSAGQAITLCSLLRDLRSSVSLTPALPCTCSKGKCAAGESVCRTRQTNLEKQMGLCGTDSGALLIPHRMRFGVTRRSQSPHMGSGSNTLSGTWPLPATIFQPPVNGRFWFKHALIP